jgi:hypothetical protein
LERRGIIDASGGAMSYQEFLESKAIAHQASGFDVAPERTNQILFPFQQEIVSRCLGLGRSANFSQTGLGKSGMEWAWSDRVTDETRKPVLLLTPLAVSKQMLRECGKFGIELRLAASQDDVSDRGIYITNYEKLRKFDPDKFGGICLDEASVLKDFSGKVSQNLVEFARSIPYRMTASATPAPNDYEEFGMQAEFLGIMSRAEMLSTFFRHDGGNTSSWKLMHYAEDRFWQWVASWAIVCRKPSDVGNFDDSPYVLPELNEYWHCVNGELETRDGELVRVMAGMGDRRSARKSSLEERCNLAIDIVNKSDEPWLVWCELNLEGNYLAKRINDAQQVSGSDKDSAKESKLLGFGDREFRVLITKSKIAGWGMNYQHCRNILFVGVDDSWERRYQAIKRCHRFGQTQEVNVRTVFASCEYPVVQNLKRKQEQADRMGDRMISVIKGIAPVKSQKSVYNPIVNMELPTWLTV